MDSFVIFLELVGTVAFAASGALVGIRKNMDIFGVCIMGIVTACGGGVLRDLFLGALPPVMFREPLYAATAAATAMLLFLPFVRRILTRSEKLYDTFNFLSDAAGLGLFTAAGVSATMLTGYGDSLFFAVFLGMVTGVGGGVMRDVLAGHPPYIFMKDIYACASLIGALLCAWLWKLLGAQLSMTVCCLVVFFIRLFAVLFHWRLPNRKMGG